MTNKIVWDFIEFENEGSSCIDGVTRESETEFHIWNDGEIFLKSTDVTQSDVCVTIEENEEILKLAKMLFKQWDVKDE